MNNRLLERQHFPCPEVNIESFPPLNEEEYFNMFLDWDANLDDDICVYIYVRKLDDGTPFVDVYIWDKDVDLESGMRFVICEGYRLREDIEETFLKYTHNSKLYLPRISIEKVNSEVKCAFPQWHFADYWSICIALDHMYFASHHGPREILYKAGNLNMIAWEFDNLPCNIEGTTPSAIFDDTPIKLLRILNSRPHIHYFSDETGLDMCKAVYRKYCGLLGKDIPAPGQWLYLVEMYNNGGTFGGYPFKWDIYDNAKYISSNEMEDYKEYLTIRKEMGTNEKIDLRDYEELYYALSRLQELKKYKKGNTHMDGRFRERLKERSRYEYRNSEFIIIMPERPYDICIEALYNHNCLVNYISAHSEGLSTILFLRKGSEPAKPFVTLEIVCDEIEQIYGRFNTLPLKEVYEFIVEFANARDLSYDLRDLVIKNMSKLKENDAEQANALIEYVMTCQTVRVGSSSPDDYPQQMTLDDVMPVVLGEETIVRPNDIYPYDVF